MQDDSNISYSCPNVTESQIDFLYFANWMLNGIFQLVICIPGILGNVTAIFLLSQKQFRCCFFNQLLVVLASYDLLYLITMALNSSEILINSSAPDVDTSYYQLVTPQFLYPLNYISMTGSILMTVGVALERYIAVTRPHYYNSVMKESSRCRLLQYLLPVTLFSLLFNVPKFFEHEVKMPELEEEEWFVAPTQLSYNSTYGTYDCLSKLVVLGILPFITFSIFNVRIYKEVIKLRKRKEKQESSLCIILIFIVLTFFICHLPRLLLNIHEIWTLEQVKYCLHIQITIMGGFPVWAILLGYISNVLMVINSSANLVIYFIIGANMRQQIRNILC